MRDDTKTTAATNSFPVVAVGASAGGLEAFSDLLRALPNNTGMAFVFIQHLDPKHHSMLSELLGKASHMPVLEATNRTTVEPNHVYVIPPNVNMGIEKHQLHLTPRSASPGLHTPIDFFMRSLAEGRNSRSIGVVLSGTASDGTRGLAAIKAEGGITFAQDEKSAKYPGMPHSAVVSGCVDFILPPDNIARELVRISGHPYLNGSQPATDRAPVVKPKRSEDTLERVMALLGNAGGINFSLYKPGTVQRRTLRRMAIHKIDHVSDYAKFLEKHPKEIEALSQDLLIPVTSFFRDLEAFESLKSKVLPAILRSKSSKESIRIWAPGCSTGEETYSLAIVLLEFLGDRVSSYQVQFFGTDVNERGIEKARAGIYEERIAQEVSPERLRRFFTKVDEGYCVSKGVRDLCVFAKQNLAEDPPFSRMNLVACRNLLIYLGPELQRKVVPILHYALRPSGFLFLGNAESVAGFSDLFSAVDKKHKIFVKKAVASKLHYDFVANRYPREVEVTDRVAEKSESTLSVDNQHEADRVVLRTYAPPGVVINENLEILQFRGAIGPYVDPAPGKATLHLLKIAKREFVGELRTAVSLAKKTRKAIKRKSVEFRRNGQLRSVNISVEPLGSSSENRQYLILFERTLPNTLAAGKPAGKSHSGGRTTKKETAKLRRKLTEAEEHLRSLVESKEASDEEYQSANEEILSANEELQSTNEELETSKEELQSANEELNTVNDELHNRNIELDRANSDLNNLVASTTLPVVMVDKGLRIRRLTAASTKVLKIVPSDIGRPIMDIRWGINVSNLEEMISSVIETLTPKELEVQDKEGRWYSLQIRPYRATDDKIDGAVIVLPDINDAKQASERVKRSEMFLEEILATVREPLVVLKQDLRVVYVNPSFLKTFQVNIEETRGKLLYSLGNEQWNIPKLRTLLDEVLSRETEVADFEVEHDFPNLGRKSMLLNARKIEEGHGNEPTMLLAIEDITERSNAEQALHQSDQRLRQQLNFQSTVTNTMTEGLYSLDAQGLLTYLNPAAETVLGWTQNELLGKKMHDLTHYKHPDGRPFPTSECSGLQVLEKGVPLLEHEDVLVRKDGSFVPVILSSAPLMESTGKITGVVVSFRDDTDQRRARRALQESEGRYRTLFDLGPIAVYSCDASGKIRDFNRGAATLWGREPNLNDFQERFCGSLKMYRPDGTLMPHGECPMADVLSGRVPDARDMEVQIERPDGSRITIIVNIRPLKNEQGEILGAINCFVDITERKLAEGLRSRLAAIVESSDDAMVSKKLDGTITTWNGAAERLFGYTSAEAVGKNVTLIVPPDLLTEETTILQRLGRGERVDHFETVRRRKDGTMVDVSLTISPLRDSLDRVVGASKVARDITEKKAAEKALQQAHDRLESMVEERTASVRQLSLRLLSVQDEEHRSISRELHDSVGQQLAGIKMDVDRLRQPKSADKQADILSKLSESVEKSMSEIRTISYLLHPPLIDDLGFSAAAKWYAEGFSERSGIKVNLELSNQSQRLPRTVELPLFRILQASLSNVHRHTKSPTVDVRFAITQSEARLEVKDHGKGIDPELLRQFKKSGGGAGIGLAGMRERLRELDGSLEVESDASGTLIRAVVPIPETVKAKKSGSA